MEETVVTCANGRASWLWVAAAAVVAQLRVLQGDRSIVIADYKRGGRQSR